MWRGAIALRGVVEGVDEYFTHVRVGERLRLFNHLGANAVPPVLRIIGQRVVLLRGEEANVGLLLVVASPVGVKIPARRRG